MNGSARAGDAARHTQRATLRQDRHSIDVDRGGRRGPKIDREMDTAALEELGARMEAQFERALAAGFRRPLRANLEQVLTGKAETRPPKGRSARGARGAARTEGRPGARGGAKRTTAPTRGKAAKRSGAARTHKASRGASKRRA